MDDDFLEYYNKHKKLIDDCIPKEVVKRLLGKAYIEAQKGDAWEPPENEGDEKCPF
jgi:hypothetical protein